MPRSIDLVLGSFFLCTVLQHASFVEAAGSGQAQAAPRPNPDESGKYHSGDGVSPPKLLYVPNPDYTARASRKHVQGKVVVALTVDSHGRTQDVHVVRSLSETVGKKLRAIALELDNNAVKAAQQYRFDPALFHGKPVPVEITVEIDYRVF